MSSTAAINYAQKFGIHSVAGAVVFAVLYVPLFFFFLRQSFARPTYVYIVTAFFCAVRIGAFAIRALLANVTADGQNLSMLIAFEVIYNVGFFGLLYSAYTLVLDRSELSDAPLPGGIISTVTRRRPLFRIVLVGAVIVGVVGAIEGAQIKNASAAKLGNTLRQISIYLFLALSILVAFQTILLVKSESAYGTYKSNNTSFGHTRGTQILCFIALLLVVREGFFTVTATNTTKQNDENLWFPFAALTELVAVVLFAAPGLVPSRADLPT